MNMGRIGLLYDQQSSNSRKNIFGLFVPRRSSLVVLAGSPKISLVSESPFLGAKHFPLVLLPKLEVA